MNRIGVGLLSVWLTGSASAATARRPNVVGIVGDDHRNSVYGAYGNPLAPTPNLDRLASQGIRFDRAYCNAPVCTSSRQSFLTGRYPRAVGVTLLRHALAEEEVTLADRLRAAGDRTGAFGKMHFNSRLTHGFEIHRTPAGFWREHRQRAADRPLPAGVKVLPPWKPFQDHARIWLNGFYRPFGRYDDEMPGSWYAREAIAFMTEHRDEPFFIQVGFHQPHSPFRFPIEDRGTFKPATLEVPAVGPEDVPQVPEIFADLVTREKQGIKASYYTAVAFLDRKVGELLEAIDRLGLTEDTLVVYLGDHGYHLGEHGRFEKHCFYENAVRAPLVMRFPGRVKPGGATDALVEFVDIVPTVLDYLGVPPGDSSPPRDLQGRSLEPLIAGRVDSVRKVVLSEFQPTGEAMACTDRYKLIYRTIHPVTDWMGYEPLMASPGRVIKLFDLQVDPEEFHNLADEPTYAATVKQLLGELEAWYRRIPPKGERPPSDLSGMAFLDWAIPPRDVPAKAVE